MHWKRQHITVSQISFSRIIFNFIWACINGLKTHLSPCQQLDQYFNTKDMISSRPVLFISGCCSQLENCLTFSLLWLWRKMPAVRKWNWCKNNDSFNCCIFHFDLREGEQVFMLKNLILPLFWRSAVTIVLQLGGKILPLPKSEQNEEKSGYNSDLVWCITGYVAVAAVVEMQMVSFVGEKAFTEKNPLGIKMWF